MSFSFSLVSGQVALAVGFLTRDPSLIWNTAFTVFSNIYVNPFTKTLNCLNSVFICKALRALRISAILKSLPYYYIGDTNVVSVNLSRNC